ncbi:2,4-dienoyl-CoA reductase-like NADH-dependent reductase (Old Yellow Enzyme family) [Actinoplanes lutulentus]|uniref:2,4-dienoyl-CoA reductase-like NADH-dependent reductase (Old Yellow Enzyme family) n=1 Tax=Actinoplanes lutulentus TaxID=1287878 RepID=A0A327Z592_9ACTN|nr:alkene reductase [Actinoplanes lutulentus]MBB2947791.1 2,4-dienoyl-CoA reductase-like NADH-dependent reductase (Old Yellow Enzyme family) [Actinoplanes lutulentus]RAK29895.1 2,4-dienoyl-CoA reductase-like NADH-dependent reductase (Old Yellow Enzyme family) [Actinoplanes lutulentus]
MSKLFTPLNLGAVNLRNRMVMAPLTRLRAGAHGVPGDLLVEHYRQRASMGLIVTEGTWPIREGRTWIGQPGIETAEQVEGWRRVADAVHAEGGAIVMQIMHGGRISHPEITGTGRIVAPSAIAAPGEVRLPDDSKADHPVPHALTAGEIPGIVAGFVAAARNAIEAGLDGVEIHSANGYLVHQFLSPASNTRTDEYGGSPANRARLAVEILTAVAGAIGADRTGLRISPEHNIQGALETDPADVAATYTALAEGLAPLGLAFVDILHADPAGELVQKVRHAAAAPTIVNTGFGTPTTRESALALLDDGLAEAVAIGRAALANPDLVARWAGDAAENAPDPSTFYAPDARGYTDYPTL